MTTKPKLIICSLIFVVGGFVNIFFSTAVHGLLDRKMTVVRFWQMLLLNAIKGRMAKMIRIVQRITASAIWDIEGTEVRLAYRKEFP